MISKLLLRLSLFSVDGVILQVYGLDKDSLEDASVSPFVIVEIKEFVNKKEAPKISV